MDSFGIYEPEMLSLFGGEQLLTGLGSPLEPDTPTTFPNEGTTIQFDLQGSALFGDKVKASNDVVPNILALPQEDNGLELGWMDTSLNLFDWIPKAERPDNEAEVAIDSPIQPTFDQGPITSAEDIFHQISDEQVNMNETSSEQDLLSEVLIKLSDYISQDDVDASAIPDLGKGVLSPVSVNDIESLLSESDNVTDLDSSGLESLLSTQSVSATSSRPESPQALEYMYDPDYCPSESECKPTRSSKSRKSTAAPYKIPTDRKLRKKLQNKTAALKYRQKKRKEATKVTSEVDQLEEKNRNLKEKADSLTREIQYLKDLMAEVLKAKGIKLH